MRLKSPKFKDSEECLILPSRLTEIHHSKSREFDLSVSSSRIKNRFSFTSTIVKIIRQTFLPINFPHSVHHTYSKIHVYQFIETFAAQCITIFTAQALLTAVGVNSPIEGGVAVAISWSITNGCGELGKLLVTNQLSYLYDAYPKSTKLAGEACCIVGNGLHISTLFFPRCFLLLASGGHCLYGIYLSIWSATHTTFNAHLSLRANSNLGDLNSKDDSQVSLAHILGLLAGIGLLSFSNSPIFITSIYLIFSALQILMTIQLIRSATYEVLNFARMRLITHEYCRSGKVMSCSHLKGTENWLGESIASAKQKTMPPIRLLRGVIEALEDPNLNDHLEILKDEKYILTTHSTEKGRTAGFGILIREEGGDEDVFKAILHASKWDQLNMELSLDNNFEKAYIWTKANSSQLLGKLADVSWKTDLLVWTDSGVRVAWD